MSISLFISCQGLRGFRYSGQLVSLLMLCQEQGRAQQLRWESGPGRVLVPEHRGQMGLGTARGLQVCPALSSRLSGQRTPAEPALTCELPCGRCEAQQGQAHPWAVEPVAGGAIAGGAWWFMA